MEKRDIAADYDAERERLRRQRRELAKEKDAPERADEQTPETVDEAKPKRKAKPSQRDD